MRHRFFGGPAPNILGRAFGGELDQGGHDDSKEQNRRVAEESDDDQNAPVRDGETAEPDGHAGTDGPEDEAVHDWERVSFVL